MTTTDWMNGTTVDVALCSKGLDLRDAAEDFETDRRWTDAADAYEVASDAFAMAGDVIRADAMRKYADRCRVWAL